MDSKQIKDAAKRFGIDLCGIAPLSRFEGVAPEKDPRQIFPAGKNIIVIGRRILRGSLRGVENGGALQGAYQDFSMFMLEDQFLAKATYDLVIWMEARGFEAVPIFGYDADAACANPLGTPVAAGKPAANVYVDWRLAAHLAGLGETGRNGLFITPEFGTLQRFAMLITDADLTADEVITRNVCENCGACEKACPLEGASKCNRCHEGAIHTDIGRFNIVDKIGAPCGRACLSSLEERSLIVQSYSEPFRSGNRETSNRNSGEVK